MNEKLTDRKLTPTEKKRLKSALEAIAIDCTPDKDWLIVVRIGTDTFPATVEDLRVVTAQIDRLKRDGYISQDMKVVTVPHTLQFSREALKDFEVFTVED